MKIPKVSLIASAVKFQIWEAFFKSLDGTSVEYEVIFAGNAEFQNLILPENFKYIKTSNIKPAQCYEIARRHATGETVVWVADDCEFPNDVIGKAYNYWKSKNNEKLILSIQTKESGYGLPIGTLFNMKNHSFFGYRPETPLMAPLGLMSREYLEKLGGIDRRYICGQYENDIVMRCYVDGGQVEIFGDKDNFIDIDHLKKSEKSEESPGQYLQRPFALGYPSDRIVLQRSWCKGNQVLKNRTDSFEPFVDDETLLTKSQSNNLTNLWV